MEETIMAPTRGTNRPSVASAGGQAYLDVAVRECAADPFERDPRKPTGAAPGSAEKIAHLGRRELEGVPLWHPLDRTGHGPARQTA